jgi:hypothetical protein
MNQQITQIGKLEEKRLKVRTVLTEEEIRVARDIRRAD